MMDDKKLEEFTVDEEKLEKVDGGADKIKGGKRFISQNTVKVDDQLNGNDDDLNIMV